MFLLGVMHDIGYEFVEHVADHAYVGGEILKQSNYQYWQEISQHGNIAVENMSDELFILNCADMTTGPNGEDFTFEERIEEIAKMISSNKDDITSQRLAEDMINSYKK